MEYLEDDDLKCPACRRTLKEPYVTCMDCVPVVNLCLQCFAKGREFSQHSSDHSYELKSASFSLFDKDWSAAEELKLLTVMMEFGYGNWQEVAKKMKPRTKDECEQHYNLHYVDKPHSSLPKFEVNRVSCLRRPQTFRASTCPPRPDATVADSCLFPVGYMAARADFVVEYDNFAECDIKDAEIDVDDDDQLLIELNLAAVNIYLDRLQERQLRKRMIRDYGLIDIGQENVMTYTYGNEEKRLRESVTVFSRLQTPCEHEKLVQGLLHEKYLKSRIKHLQEYRLVGLRKLLDASIYERLKRRRKMFKPRKTFLDEVLLHLDHPALCQVWLQRQLNGNKAVPLMPCMPLLGRKPARYLDLTGLPDLEKLTDDEKNLCSAERLTPAQFLSCKSTLVKASREQGGLRLADARLLIKIDVNKTRKLYDFLTKKGLVSTFQE